MKILESQSAVLTNHEVLAHIRTSLAKPRSIPQKHVNVETVLTEITHHLQPPPSSPPGPIPSYTHPLPTIKTLMERLQPYQLTKSELLMIMNLQPRDLGLLDCVVEECDERFSLEQQEEILHIIGDVLGREPGAQTNGVNGHGDGDVSMEER